MSSTVEELLNQSSETDDDKVAHYVEKDEMMIGLVYGVPIIALCGKIWIPSRDGEGSPICKSCEEIYSQLSQ